MEKNQHPHRKIPFDMRDVKRLIFVLAVASTLGFWALFSNKFDFNSFAKTYNNDTAAGTVPPSQMEEQLALDLPPIPTLIPTLAPLNANAAAQPVTAQNPVSSAPVQSLGSVPQVPVATRLTVKPKAKPASKPAPVTVTRSSKP